MTTHQEENCANADIGALDRRGCDLKRHARLVGILYAGFNVLPACIEVTDPMQAPDQHGFG